MSRATSVRPARRVAARSGGPRSPRARRPSNRAAYSRGSRNSSDGAGDDSARRGAGEALRTVLAAIVPISSLSTTVLSLATTSKMLKKRDGVPLARPNERRDFIAFRGCRDLAGPAETEGIGDHDGRG